MASQNQSIQTTSVESTHPHGGDSARLVSELSDYLSNLAGNDERGSYDVELVNADKDAFVVLRLDDKPVACGAIRYIDFETCELKRMFSKQQGMGTEILHVLENKARLLGYSKVILPIRKRNEKTVGFYRKHGYQRVSAFEKHEKSEISVSLGKQL